MKIENTESIFSPTKVWRIAILLSILVCGFATRLFDITDPPLDYASSRQLRSAIIARGIYYGMASDVNELDREVALNQKGRQEMLEPQILENLVAFTYLIVGGEYVWIARIFSSLFWTFGGLALYALTREIVSEDGAVVALIYYLFVPFGLLASRTFQPDPLMTATIVFAWLSLFRWGKARSWNWAWITGLTAGAAILIKSTAIFFLAFSMAGFVFSEFKLRDLIKDLQIWLIVILSTLPAILYHLYGFFVSGALQGQLQGRLFNSRLWNDPGFYTQWLNTSTKVLGHLLILVVALLGVFLIKKGGPRWFLITSWLGFLVYGFAVSYYVTTHSYYLLPIIPLAAITIGAAADWLLIRLIKIKLRGLVRAGTLAVLILGVALGYFIYQAEDFRHEPDYYYKVASYVSPDKSIIALSQDYGFRLAYYGWINVQPWSQLENLLPPGEKITEQNPYSSRFLDAMENFDFFIITRMKDYKQQTDLKNELVDHYPVLKEGGGYMIYDLRERLD